ncbi:MAG: hypothetical protein MR636_01280, partial [Clostridiales bacterium]|nr:hypothetical protein [Clostridiales bacterium]
MRKFLSILMLACLLCGMVLPAGAEGEPAQLYAKVGDGASYQTNLTFEAGNTLTAKFYISNSDDSTAIVAAEGFNAQEGLSIGTPDENGNRSLSASTAGSYSLSYVLNGTTYSMTITVTVPTTNTITVPDALPLNTILSDQTAFDAFLTTNHYSGSGDLTLLLPAGNLESVVCGVSLSNGSSLILKGTANLGTTVQGGLTI